MREAGDFYRAGAILSRDKKREGLLRGGLSEGRFSLDFEGACHGWRVEPAMVGEQPPNFGDEGYVNMLY